MAEYNYWSMVCVSRLLIFKEWWILILSTVFPHPLVHSPGLSIGFLIISFPEKEAMSRSLWWVWRHFVVLEMFNICKNGVLSMNREGCKKLDAKHFVSQRNIHEYIFISMLLIGWNWITYNPMKWLSHQNGLADFHENRWTGKLLWNSWNYT